MYSQNLHSYPESMDILWSHSSIIHLQIMDSSDFHSSDFRILSDIRSALLPRSFHAIRCLEISLLHAFLDHQIQILDDEWYDQWTSLWNVIKCLKGLLHVQAWLKMDQEPGNMMTADQEARLFAPLMELGWIQDFKIEGIWPANEGFESLLLGGPFQTTIAGGGNRDLLVGKLMTILNTYGIHMTSRPYP
jgi:hypothetical protein